MAVPVARKPLYVGCCRRAGHYRFEPGMRSLPWLGALRLGGISLDGGFCPPGEQVEGDAKLTWVEDDDGGPLTVLAFWDRSVDRRHGSNSTFVLPGVLDFGDALDAARDAFPEVFARYPFVVVPWVPS